MQPTYPILLSRESEPNLELLRRVGWSIGSFAGRYCVAWRGQDELVLEWEADGWHRVDGRGAVDEI